MLNFSQVTFSIDRDCMSLGPVKRQKPQLFYKLLATQYRTKQELKRQKGPLECHRGSKCGQYLWAWGSKEERTRPKGLEEEFQDPREGVQRVSAVSLKGSDKTGLRVWTNCRLGPSVASEVSCSCRGVSHCCDEADSNKKQTGRSKFLFPPPYLQFATISFYCQRLKGSLAKEKMWFCKGLALNKMEWDLWI